MTRIALAPIVLAVCASAALADGPPATAKEPVTDTLHGVELTDDYRWLEGDDEGNLTDRVSEWTDAQNAYTRQVLEGLPGRDAVETRIRELMTTGWVGAPTVAGTNYFYRKQEGEQNQGVLFVREGHDGEPRVLLDPNTLDSEGLISLDWIAPSHSGELLAFGLSHAGDENTTVHVLEVSSGEWLSDAIPDKAGSVNWLPDESGFLYDCLDDIEDPYSSSVRVHQLGRHHRHNDTLFKQYSTSWGPFGYLSKDARWLILGYYTTTSANDLWVVDFDHYRRTGEVVKVDILVGADARSAGPIVGDTLYMHTTFEAPNGRVVAVDLNRPAQENWVEVVPHREDATLKGVSEARGMLVGTYLKDASSRIERFALDGTSLGELELPGIGTASIGTSDDRTEAFLTFRSYNEPTSIYRVDLATGERALWERVPVPVDPSTVEVKQVWYESTDGTRVSMFLVHKKGIELTGDNPTLLYGYGGFNISMTPYFSATLFQWFEAGGVYAVANLRGGGEYGAEWHHAGMLDQKQNVFDDFITAAEWLISNNYTNSDRLAIQGGSNGGLLTGAVVVQRPDLYAAAISAVPLLDMIRFHQFLMARFWVPEYGSSEVAEQFAFLREYSPYQNIHEGVEYPAVMFTAGENDTRVHPLHARKMAAAMQAATASDPAVDPILLWVERDAGHGGGKPLHLRIRDVADQRMFLMWQLGMLDE
ncbi:prolyl oligopeptidase family serine peptidase [Planctomycetota bacterium]|nr:prolyl oligopeptidase family serine peptidase [Planctomycetota bacterium]